MTRTRNDLPHRACRRGVSRRTRGGVQRSLAGRAGQQQPTGEAAARPDHGVRRDRIWSFSAKSRRNARGNALARRAGVLRGRQDGAGSIRSGRRCAGRWTGRNMRRGRAHRRSRRSDPALVSAGHPAGQRRSETLRAVGVFGTPGQRPPSDAVGQDRRVLGGQAPLRRLEQPSRRCGDAEPEPLVAGAERSREQPDKEGEREGPNVSPRHFASRHQQLAAPALVLELARPARARQNDGTRRARRRRSLAVQRAGMMTGIGSRPCGRARPATQARKSSIATAT
jgi:hypothetical protein